MDRPIIERLSRRPFRDRVFATGIKRAYDNTCAISGLRIINGGGRAEAQAAHIQPVAENGPDSLRNGVALSSTFHWMFDRGLISIDDDYSLLFKRNAIPGNVLSLVNDDRRLRLPGSGDLSSAPAFSGVPSGAGVQGVMGGGGQPFPGLHRSVRKLLDTHSAIRLVLSARRAKSEDGAQKGRRKQMSVEELVREMERIEGWQLVDECISVDGPRTAPGSCMCPIVAVHWYQDGEADVVHPIALESAAGREGRGPDLKAADGVPGHDRGLRGRMMEAAGLDSVLTGIELTSRST